jgi:hypothetical protein
LLVVIPEVKGKADCLGIAFQVGVQGTDACDDRLIYIVKA